MLLRCITSIIEEIENVRSLHCTSLCRALDCTNFRINRHLDYYCDQLLNAMNQKMIQDGLNLSYSSKDVLNEICISKLYKL